MAGLLAVLLAVVFGLLAGTMHYEEDITRFLPGDERSARYSEVYNALGKKNNIVVIFSAKEGSQADEYSIQKAIHAFGELFEALDTIGPPTDPPAGSATDPPAGPPTDPSADSPTVPLAGPGTGRLVPDRQITVDPDKVFAMMEAVASAYPLYLTEADYQRIDSLLGVPGYVEAQLAADRNALQFPSGDMGVHYIQSDPLNLFTPVLQRLRTTAANSNYSIVDDCLFTKDGKGLAFLTSPFGMSESGMNAKVAELVQEAATRTMEAHPGIVVSAVGAPLIAVANASRIKKDGMLAISLAILLIGLLLAFTYKRFSDIAWIGISIAFGWIFAAGGMALLRDSMSIIVLGVASVIIGIAVNYPLHYVDGFKAGVTARMNLREMVPPLLIGNVTTIAAFLCLVWLDAVAMKDLGLFGSLMLAGTILFVLVFLPVFAKPRGMRTDTLELGKLLPEKAPASGWLFLAVMAVTVVMGFLGGRTGFDPSMQSINFMTEQQRSDLRMLEAGQDTEGYSMLYAIAEGASLEEALRNNDALQERITSAEPVSFVKGAGNFIPSVETQKKRIDRWTAFWSEDRRGEKMLAALKKEGAAAGFSEEAFAPFLELFGTPPKPRGMDANAPGIAAFDGTYVLNEGGKFLVLNQIYYSNPESRDGLYRALESDGTLVFDTGDISSRLVKVLSESFDFIGLLCSLVVFIFLLLSFRRLELSLLAFLPLAVSWFWILGVMGLFDIRFNIVNIILATFIFGQGDDYTLFITEGLIYEYAYGKKRLSTYKNSVFHSAVIMFIGIGTLVLAKHPAMRSLGLVTVIGMFIVVMMACYFPPLIFRWLTEKRGRKRDVPLTLKRLLYSGFALVCFVLFMFLFVYPYTFFHFLGKNSEEKKLRYHRFLQKVARFMTSHVPGVSYRSVSGAELDEPAVIIANHQSHLDLACIMALTPKVVFFTNEWVWKNPIYGYVLRKAEYYPIADGLEKNLDRIKDLVARGYSLCVFPEGTRTRDGRIGRFHKGAFYVASKLGLDIVPVFLHGAFHVLPKTDFMLREGSVTVEVGERMDSHADYHQLTKDFHRLYLDRYARMSRELETPMFLAKYVRYKYLYKGAGVEARCRKVLAAVEGSRIWDIAAGGRVDIHDCGQGECSLIYALMHPDTEVHAYDRDEENILLASNCSNLPSNLHYHLEAE